MMNFDKEIMDNKESNLPYEKPTLEKYGNMKSIVSVGTGSVGPVDESNPKDPDRNNDVNFESDDGLTPIDDAAEDTPIDFVRVDDNTGGQD